MSLYFDWIEAKMTEEYARNRRREIEDKLIKSLEIHKTLDGTINIEDMGYKIKVVGRMSRKVDADKLQEVAREAGIDGYLTTLFRWKPEINMATWKNTDPSITGVLAKAITVEPSRPSFTIEKE